MYKTYGVLTLMLVTVLMLVSCIRTPVGNIDPVRFQGHIDRYPIEHVVVFAIDGLKHSTLLTYLRQAKQRVGGLHDLVGATTGKEGLAMTKAVGVRTGVTVFPSYTYPAWASMFTGVYPGTHGITGNSVFFRDRRVVRYYTDFHIDAVKVQLERDLLANDINEQTKTLYQYVDEAGGQSLVVHNMVIEGSERGHGARKPSFDTLWSYQRNRSLAVDENTLWEAVRSLKDFNKKSTGQLALPTVMTIYFSGLDHAEHLSPQNPEQARLDYLDQIDELLAKFMEGDDTIVRNHYKTPAAEEPVQVDALQWQGLAHDPVFQRTLFLVVSDHGHTPINWAQAVSIDDVRLMFDELGHRSGRAYHVEDPVLIKDSFLSKVHAAFGLFDRDRVSSKTNVVATLNGGALGLHVKPADASWDQRPDYTTELKPILEHLLLTLHKNELGPQAVFYNTGTRYVLIPYQYDGSGITVLPAVEVEDSLFNSPQYPLAVRRIRGLASRLDADPLSAPDLVFLADRSRKLTYLNKEDARVIEGLDIRTHRHFHADHGHLDASDSLVPILFRVGGYAGSTPLSSICAASIVDLAPTLLEAIGMTEAFDRALANYSRDVKGHSLLPLLPRILNGAESDAVNNICSPSLTNVE